MLMKTLLQLGFYIFATSIASHAQQTVASQVEAIRASLTIPHADDVRGNITLPTWQDGATITWKSSRPDIITDKDIRLKDCGNAAYTVIPAGVVSRQDKNVRVELTATIKKQNQTARKIFFVTVKARVPQKKAEAYIFLSFLDNHHEQVYFSAGKDPLHFTDLNQGKPVLLSTVGNKGVRDPYLLRSHEGDRFYLLATDLKVQTQGFETENGSLDIVVWESTDLVNWSDPRLVDVGARDFIKKDGRHLGCVYAPEAIYDKLTGEYVVFWASRVYPDYPRTKSGRRYKIFYSRTRDFVHFTPGQLYIDRGNGNIIDTSMLCAADGKYYRVSADGLMSIEQADSILGTWRKLSDLTNLHKKMSNYDLYMADTQVELKGKRVEGPELFKFNNENQYGLYADNYQKPGIGYIPTTTTSLNDTTGRAWQLYTREQYHFGKQKKRHGSILGITQQEYDAIMKKWGRPYNP